MWRHEALLHFLNAAFEFVFGEFVASRQTHIVLLLDELHSKQMEIVFLSLLQNLRVEGHINNTVLLYKTHRKSNCLKLIKEKIK